MRRYLFLAAVSILGAAAVTVSSQVLKYPGGAAVVLGAIVGCGGTSVNVDSGTFYIDCSNNRLGVANSSPQYALDVTGAIVASGQGVFGGTTTVRGNAFSVGNTTFSISAGVISAAIQPCVRAKTSGAIQSIPNDTSTAFFFDQEDYDRGGLHSVSASSQNVTVPSDGAGIWFVSCQATFVAAANGQRQAVIRINGTGIKTTVMPGSAAMTGAVPATDILSLSAADVITCDGYQDSGGPVNGNANAALTACKIW